MPDLRTNYMGLELRTPLVVSANPMSQKIDNIVAMEDAGAGAVVLFSLFCGLGLFVTFVGIFFRGPGYSFVIPYLTFFEIGTPGLHFAL